MLDHDGDRRDLGGHALERHQLARTYSSLGAIVFSTGVE